MRENELPGRDVCLYQQFYLGLPVRGAQYLVHRDAETGELVFTNGSLAYRLDIDTKASVSEDEAFRAAVEAIGTRVSDYSPQPAGTLSIVAARSRPGLRDWHLAWAFSIPPVPPSGEYRHGGRNVSGAEMSISATTGDIVASASWTRD